MKIPNKWHLPAHYLKLFVKWGLLGILMGAWGGLLGAGMARIPLACFEKAMTAFYNKYNKTEERT